MFSVTQFADLLHNVAHRTTPALMRRPDAEYVQVESALSIGIWISDYSASVPRDVVLFNLYMSVIAQ